jgi:hypothetical protein
VADENLLLANVAPITIDSTLTHLLLLSMRSSSFYAHIIIGDAIYMYDPMFQIFDNTAESPLPDGGGDVIVDLQYSSSAGTTSDPYGPKCSNVPRTFVNENDCVLSQSPNACTVAAPVDEDINIRREDAFFTLSHETIRTIYRETGGAGAAEGRMSTMHLYAVDGLDIERDPDVQSPCTPGVVSRWVPVECSEEEDSRVTFVGARTTNIMSRWINNRVAESSSDPLFVNLRFPRRTSHSCDVDDMDVVGFEVPDLNIVSSRCSRCWRNVHPDHLNVYDFTQWTQDHPGNFDRRNPIKEFAEAGETRLLFPDWHDLNRWIAFKENSRFSVPLGGRFNYYRLPARYRTRSLALALGIETTTEAASSLMPSNIGGPGTLVCGSPNEVANDPELGGESGRGAFVTPVSTRRERHFAKQREITWTISVLTDPGQLRQRIAWALSQILAVNAESFSTIQAISYTEPFLVYYDIFVSVVCFLEPFTVNAESISFAKLCTICFVCVERTRLAMRLETTETS